MNKINNLLNNSMRILRFSIPISSGLLINMFANFMAMMMVAHIGKVELAAASLSITTYMTVMTVVSTIFYAISILISHQRGKEHSESAIGEILKNGLWMALILTIPSGLVLWNLDKVLLVFKQDSQLVSIAKGYFHFAALSMIPTLLGSVITQFFMGIGKPRFTMITALLNLPIMLIFSYGFVTGHFGLPSLGLAGVSCSMFLTQTLVFGTIFVYMHYSGVMQKYAVFSKQWLPNLSICKSIFKLGMPIGIQSGAELAAMSVAMYFMGFCGVTALAATQVVSQYILMIVMMLIGLSQGLSIIVSQAYGRNDTKEVLNNFKASMLILTVLSLIVFTLFTTQSIHLAQFFVSQEAALDTELMHLTQIMFIIATVMLFLDGARNLLTGVLRGIQDSKSPMKINIACLWFISLPVSYFVAFNLNGGAIGLRIAFLSGFVVSTFLLWVRVNKKLNPENNPISWNQASPSLDAAS